MASVQTALTHRDHAQGVVFITGHRQKEGQPTHWAELARTAHQAQLTLVIYMGLSQVAHIQAQLLLGLPAQTPVALLQDISLPQQRQALTQLGDLVHCVSEHGFVSPTVMVVGQVVAGMQALGLNEGAAPKALKTQP
jgi:uroporphyrin-III C-methyltransferase